MHAECCANFLNKLEGKNMRRRGRNEGSICKRRDGRWEARIDLGWRASGRRRRCFYGATRAEVQELLTAALCDQQQGLLVAVERQTVGEFLINWLRDCVKSTVRPLTLEQYAQHVRLYLLPQLGRIRLTKLSPQQVQAFVNTKLNDGLSPRTVQLSLMILSRALGQAVKWDLLGRNVATLVDAPRVERPELRPPTREQVRKLLDATKGQRLEAIYTVGLALGMRRGELLGLRWSDVDMEARTITVRRALQRSGGLETTGEASKLRFVEPKTARGRRTIVMPDCVVAALRTHRARQAQERLVAGAEWQDIDLIFATRKGTAMEPRSLDTAFKRMLHKAGLPKTIRLHDGRHFAATLLLEQGAHPRTVMEILGHSDISLTLNTYSHVVAGVMREAAEKVDAAFAELG